MDLNGNNSLKNFWFKFNTITGNDNQSSEFKSNTLSKDILVSIICSLSSFKIHNTEFFSIIHIPCPLIKQLNCQFYQICIVLVTWDMGIVEDCMIVLIESMILFC